MLEAVVEVVVEVGVEVVVVGVVVVDVVRRVSLKTVRALRSCCAMTQMPSTIRSEYCRLTSGSSISIGRHNP